MFLSVCLSVFLSISFSVSQFFCIYVFVSLSLSAHLPVCLSRCWLWSFSYFCCNRYCLCCCVCFVNDVDANIVNVKIVVVVTVVLWRLLSFGSEWMILPFDRIGSFKFEKWFFQSNTQMDENILNYKNTLQNLNNFTENLKNEWDDFKFYNGSIKVFILFFPINVFCP